MLPIVDLVDLVTAHSAELQDSEKLLSQCVEVNCQWESRLAEETSATREQIRRIESMLSSLKLEKSLAEEKAEAEKKAADLKAAEEQAAADKKAAEEKAAADKKAAEENAAAEAAQKEAAEKKAAADKNTIDCSDLKVSTMINVTTNHVSKS